MCPLATFKLDMNPVSTHMHIIGAVSVRIVPTLFHLSLFVLSCYRDTQFTSEKLEQWAEHEPRPLFGPYHGLTLKPSSFDFVELLSCLVHGTCVTQAGGKSGCKR